MFWFFGFQILSVKKIQMSQTGRVCEREPTPRSDRRGPAHRRHRGQPAGGATTGQQLPRPTHPVQQQRRSSSRTAFIVTYRAGREQLSGANPVRRLLADTQPSEVRQCGSVPLWVFRPAALAPSDQPFPPCLTAAPCSGPAVPLRGTVLIHRWSSSGPVSPGRPQPSTPARTTALGPCFWRPATCSPGSSSLTSCPECGSTPGCPGRPHCRTCPTSDPFPHVRSPLQKQEGLDTDL